MPKIIKIDHGILVAVTAVNSFYLQINTLLVRGRFEENTSNWKSNKNKYSIFSTSAEIGTKNLQLELVVPRTKICTDNCIR